MAQNDSENVAEILWDKSQSVVRNAPGKLAGVLSDLIWTMDDNGAEVVTAVERWLESADYFRVREALLFDEVFPFQSAEKMAEVFERIKKTWPDLSVRCDEVIKQRAKQGV